MSSLYGNVSSGASGFDPYSNKKFLHGTKDFLQSNSLVAKLAFLILVIFSSLDSLDLVEFILILSLTQHS